MFEEQIKKLDENKEQLTKIQNKNKNIVLGMFKEFLNKYPIIDHIFYDCNDSFHLKLSDDNIETFNTRLPLEHVIDLEDDYEYCYGYFLNKYCELNQYERQLIVDFESLKTLDKYDLISILELYIPNEGDYYSFKYSVVNGLEVD